jgi:hypothetical protein
MTLICTAISNFGLIQASDSNLTGRSGAAGGGQKVFSLGFVPGALALAGNYRVDRQRMDEWLPDFIDAYAASEHPSLKGFSHHLRDHLSEEQHKDRSQGGRLFHIAGYVETEDGWHPEMWFVRDFSDIDPATGEYVRADDYLISEDFWTRDYADRGIREAIQMGGYQRYFNGTPPGRISFLGVSQLLQAFFAQVWQRADWPFRPPESLSELGSFIKLEITAVATLYGSSDYPASIGGSVQMDLTPPPPGSVHL